MEQRSACDRLRSGGWEYASTAFLSANCPYPKDHRHGSGAQPQPARDSPVSPASLRVARMPSGEKGLVSATSTFAVLDRLAAFELSICLRLRLLGSRRIRAVFVGVSRAGDGWLWLALAVMLPALAGGPGWAATLEMARVAGVCLPTYKLLKRTTARPRPSAATQRARRAGRPTRHLQLPVRPHPPRRGFHHGRRRALPRAAVDPRTLHRSGGVVATLPLAALPERRRCRGLPRRCDRLARSLELARSMNLLHVSDVYFPRINGVSTSIRGNSPASCVDADTTSSCWCRSTAARLDEEDVVRVRSKAVPFDREDRLMHPPAGRTRQRLGSNAVPPTWSTSIPPSWPRRWVGAWHGDSRCRRWSPFTPTSRTTCTATCRCCPASCCAAPRGRSTCARRARRVPWWRRPPRSATCSPSTECGRASRSSPPECRSTRSAAATVTRSAAASASGPIARCWCTSAGWRTRRTSAFWSRCWRWCAASFPTSCCCWRATDRRCPLCAA